MPDGSRSEPGTLIGGGPGANKEGSGWRLKRWKVPIPGPRKVIGIS
jgi:hypothetical protein